MPESITNSKANLYHDYDSVIKFKVNLRMLLELKMKSLVS